MPASKAVIGELRDWARRARAMADAEALAWLRGLKSRPPFERAIGLWAWSEALTASADSDAALSEIARWLREGDADDVRAAALVIVWRAGPALAPLAAPLAGRLSSNDTIDTRRWAAFALHGLVEAKAPIAPAFPALFQALEQDSERLWV